VIPAYEKNMLDRKFSQDFRAPGRGELALGTYWKCIEGVSNDGHDIRPMCLRGQRKAPIVQPGLVHVGGCEHSDTN
jgi:hypothetical protein